MNEFDEIIVDIDEKMLAMRSIREEAGISLTQLADTLGVSKQAASQWERGETRPDYDNLVRLNRCLDYLQYQNLKKKSVDNQ